MLEIKQNPPLPSQYDDISVLFELSVRDALSAQIEADVLEWLKDEKADPIKEFHFKNAVGESVYLPIVLFERAEINIKTCANCWERWRIANGPWPRLISYKVGNYSANTMFDFTQDVLPNEIRGDNY